MNPGHRIPSSKLRTVPVTTPAANSADHHLRPPAGERQVDLVAASGAEPLGEHDERGERDPEAHDRDVHREGERLQLPRLEQVVLLGGAAELGDHVLRRIGAEATPPVLGVDGGDPATFIVPTFRLRPQGQARPRREPRSMLQMASGAAAHVRVRSEGQGRTPLAAYGRVRDAPW